MKKYISLLIILSAIIVLLSACSKESDSGSKDKKSKASDKTVTFTLKGNLELDIKDDIGNIVYEINQNNGAVFNVQSMQRYKSDKKGNLVRFSDGETMKAVEAADSALMLHADRFSNGVSSDNDFPGYLEFYFTESNSNLKRISLFDGWKGLFPRLEKFLTDDNSIDYSRGRVGLFKDGKMVSVSELTDDYEKKAKEVIEKYDGKLVDYYMANGYAERNDAVRHLNGIVGGFWKNVNNFLDMLSKADGYEDKADDIKLKAYCMMIAMIEWSVEGENYGSVLWETAPSDLCIAIPCSSEDYERVRKAPKEDGE